MPAPVSLAIRPRTAARFAGGDSWRVMMAGRLFEAAAALAVLAFGVTLLYATLAGGTLRG